MSAFLVENKTISKLANDILKENPQSFGYDNESKLAEALYELNVEALKQRYNDVKDMIVPFEFLGGTFGIGDSGLAQFYKSLSCFLYQCCEGNVTELEFYKKLEEIRNDIARKIAGNWVDTQNAEWN